MPRRAILTAEEMRQAEARAIAAGTPVEMLMERAGTAAAEAIWRFAGPLPALILCGPGNNGGDGYVIARRLQERGIRVQVAALGEPKSAAAVAARSAWSGTVKPIEAAEPAPLLVDSLFGTGLTRGLNPELCTQLHRLADPARVRVAVDLPSGVATDDGRILSPVPDFDLTVTFATLKPSHLLQPAARHMGRIAVADIGIEVDGTLVAIDRPVLKKPGPDDHKYCRGFVAAMAGDMPGAIALTAAAALRAGAGYVRLIGPIVPGLPHAIVQDASAKGSIDDPRIGAAVIGPGLGRGEEARRRLLEALNTGPPLVIDADGLVLLADVGLPHLRGLREMAILTPHAGEFDRLFGISDGSKLDRALAAATAAQAVIVFKGADSVVAAPDGRAAIARTAPAWLASAGTGDVLAGIIAAMRSSGLDAFDAACTGVWLHARAALLAGPGLIADDLIGRLTPALAECCD